MNLLTIVRDAIVSALVLFIGSLIINFIRSNKLLYDEQAAQILSITGRRSDELKQLYTDIFSLLEQTIRQEQLREPFNLTKEWGDASAKIHLLAPLNIRSQYDDVSTLLYEWSRLYAATAPRQMKVGEHTITFMQSPDPAEKYREPTRAAYDKLQDGARELMDSMRMELDRDTMQQVILSNRSVSLP